jgi:hypothetical protein
MSNIITNKQLNRVKIPPEDLFKVSHFFKLLGSRIIPTVLYNYNDKSRNTFIDWQGNACIQTAFLTYYYLSIFLLNHKMVKNLGLCNMYIYEGQFQEGNLKYNHAWVYAKENIVNDEIPFNFLVDVARVTNTNLFVAGYNVEPDPTRIVSNYTLLSFNQLKYHDLHNQPEFYTGLKGSEFIELFNKEIKQYNLPTDLLDLL